MNLRREFLGWEEHFLVSAAKLLVDRGEKESVIDLSQSICVLQVSRAGRRLLELLVAEAEERNKFLIPPEIINIGALPERIITSPKPIISDLRARLFFLEALRSSPTELVSKILSDAPAKNELNAWLGFADEFLKLARELSANLLSFKSVAEKGQSLANFFDSDRFYALEEIYQNYLRLVEEAGYLDKHQARLLALSEEEFQLDKEIYLLSTSEINDISIEILKKTRANINVLIHAPEERSEYFDDFARVVEEKWLNETLEISDQQIAIVDGPEASAERVVDFIADLGAEFSQQEIAIGVCNPELSPYLEERLLEEDIVTQDPSSASLLNSRVVKLLSQLEKYLSTKQYRDFASFLRHEDMQNFLQKSSNLVDEISSNSIKILDDYYAEHLPARIEGKVPEVDSFAKRFNNLYLSVEELVADFKKSALGIKDWSEKISNFLIKIYGGKQRSRHDKSDKQLLDVLSKISEILGELSIFSSEKLSSSQALKLVLSSAKKYSLTAEYSEDALEILGWLELQLDDAKVLSVSGMNEGFVPESINSDIFFPNTLRAHLGLVDNDKRYARDMFILKTLIKSKKHLQLIASRRNAKSDVLMPSRLFYACGESEIAKRVLNFYQEESEQRFFNNESKNKIPLELPPIPDVENLQIEKILVTGFRSYLRCPYRFYLEQVLKLKKVDDSEKEMNALLFGKLAHQVLSDFGSSDVSKSKDSKEIYDFLNRVLNELSIKTFSNNALPAVYVQIEQLRSRLLAFSSWQAEFRREGWEIVYSEQEKSVFLNLDNSKSVELVGRIDRVDRNVRTGEWAIFDYKTGDTAVSPEKSHRKRGEWTDLQLPIYNFLLKEVGLITSDARMAYIQITSDPSKIKAEWAQWDSQDLVEASEIMYWAAERITEKEFWPPAEIPAKYDDFSLICGNPNFIPESVDELEADD